MRKNKESNTMRVSRVFVFIFVVLVSISASAQSTRTWVSGNGDDANPCSFTAPCKTFAGAFSKTIAGGEISVQDAGSYGTLTVTHSITIDGGGNFASVLHTYYTAINVNITADDLVGNTVILRGINFEGAKDWGYGVYVGGTVATHVQLEDLTFNRSGIAVEMHPGAAGSTLKMNNIEITKPISNGIVIVPPAAGTPLRVWLNNVRVSKSGQTGLLLQTNTTGVISNSTFENCNNGVVVNSPTVHVGLVRNVLANNTVNGFQHAAAATTTLLDGCSIMGNGVGVANTGSTVVGYSNNAIGYNNNDVVGNPISTVQGQ
jgi:hypothetical protein